MRHGLSHMTAAGLGLEPRYHAPEACVLPLDDPAIQKILANFTEMGN